MALDFFDDELLTQIHRRLNVEEGALHDAVYAELEQPVADEEDTIISEAFGLARLMLDGIVDKVTPKQALMRLPNILRNILMGVPLCPLTDDPDEWEELPEDYESFVESQGGKTMWFTTDHLEGTSVDVECIEQNIRYPLIRRFNHDSRTAHRIDAIAYFNKDTGEQIDPHEYAYSTMRFIPIPYLWGPPIKVYIDPRTGAVARDMMENVRGNAMDGTVIPRYIQEIVEQEAKDNGASADLDLLDALKRQPVEDAPDDDPFFYDNGDPKPVFRESDPEDEPTDDGKEDEVYTEEDNETFKKMANGILGPLLSSMLGGLPPVDEPEEEITKDNIIDILSYKGEDDPSDDTEE